MQKTQIIESLIMKSLPKYNNSASERASCLIKARKLAEKFNLIDFYNRLIIKHIGVQAKQQEKQRRRQEQERRQKQRDQERRKSQEQKNRERKEDNARRQKEEQEQEQAREAFYKEFYINANGNYVYRDSFSNNYITIKKCKNNSWGVFYNNNATFWSFKEQAFYKAWEIYQDL